MTEGWYGANSDENDIIADDAQEQNAVSQSDAGIPVTDKNPEYSKLLNEVVTLRWKCGDQAAEIARLQAERDAIVAWLRSDRIVVTMDGSAEDVIASAIEVGEHLKEYGK
jgi:hypothetical protein